jgi:hypothetical protein
VGPRAVLDAVVKRKIPGPRQEFFPVLLHILCNRNTILRLELNVGMD